MKVPPFIKASTSSTQFLIIFLPLSQWQQKLRPLLHQRTLLFAVLPLSPLSPPHLTLYILPSPRTPTLRVLTTPPKLSLKLHGVTPYLSKLVLHPSPLVRTALLTQDLTPSSRGTLIRSRQSHRRSLIRRSKPLCMT